MSDFLPTNYDLPASSSDNNLFMKLADGDNKIRILQPPLRGFLYWGVDDKPYRLKKQINRPYNMRSHGKFGPERVKHFWALLVWDYTTEAVRILEVSQVTIQEQIIKLNNDADWGNPTGYNLKIMKTTEKKGNRDEVKYLVIPSPNANVPPGAIASLNETPINLNALYFGGKPNTPDTEWKTEARNKVYEWIGQLYEEATKRGVIAAQMDFNAAELHECLTYYEDLLEQVSKAPTVVIAASTPVVASASGEEMPF